MCSADIILTHITSSLIHRHRSAYHMEAGSATESVEMKETITLTISKTLSNKYPRFWLIILITSPLWGDLRREVERRNVKLKNVWGDVWREPSLKNKKTALGRDCQWRQRDKRPQIVNGGIWASLIQGGGPLTPGREQMKPGSVWIHLARVHKWVMTGNGDKMASKTAVTATSENCGLISMVLQKKGK